MITEDCGLQSTKITKDYRPSVRDYSHVADPSVVTLFQRRILPAGPVDDDGDGIGSDGIDDKGDGNNYNDEGDESVVDNDEEDENAELDLESQDNKDVVILQYYLYLLYIIEIQIQ